METTDISIEQRVDQIIEIRNQLIDHLLSQTHRFKHVFQTEKGSKYFVLESGESFRAKMMDEENDHEFGMHKQHFYFCQIIKKISFISTEKTLKLAHKFENGIPNNIQIKTFEIAEGVSPIEFDITPDYSNLIIKEDMDTLTIINPTESEDENLWIPYHIGHPINSVIKR